MKLHEEFKLYETMWDETGFTAVMYIKDTHKRDAILAKIKATKPDDIIEVLSAQDFIRQYSWASRKEHFKFYADAKGKADLEQYCSELPSSKKDSLLSNIILAEAIGTVPKKFVCEWRTSTTSSTPSNVAAAQPAAAVSVNANQGKFALAHVFYDYGWFWKTIDENEDGSVCYTRRHSNQFCDNKKYTGKLYNSIAECYDEVANNLEKYIQYALPENIDYASGRKNGTIGAIELNEAQDEFIKITCLFDCKARKLVKSKY
jgi:hypothetical protein